MRVTESHTSDTHAHAQRFSSHTRAHTHKGSHPCARTHTSLKEAHSFSLLLTKLSHSKLPVNGALFSSSLFTRPEKTSQYASSLVSISLSFLRAPMRSGRLQTLPFCRNQSKSPPSTTYDALVQQEVICQHDQCMCVCFQGGVGEDWGG